MMGLGYLGSSSSSSASSNLSPLAPPFTVDRSNHNKPVGNSNSLSHLNDPSYFTSSWPYSHSSTAARQKNLADSPRTSTLPSNDSGYMIPELGNLPTAGSWSGLNSNGKHGLEQITPGRSPHWAAVYPSPKRVTDSLSYNLSEAKPFYPSSDDVPLVTFSEPSYDLLSTSGLAHGDETETSQVDYTRSLSGLEYNHHQQDSVWSEGKQVKKMETDDSFFSDSLAYNSYLNQGGYGTETSSKSKDDVSLFYYADMIRRANHTGPSSNGKSDGTTTTSSFSANSSNNNNNHRIEFDPNDLSKGGSAFRAFPMFSECHPLIHSPEDVWNTQSSYNHHHHPYEKRYQMFDCSDDHMIAKSSSSTLVIKPPASKSLEIGSLSALNINGHKTLKEKEQSGLAPNQLSCFQIGRTDADAPPCSTKGEEEEVSMSCVNEQLSFEFKARPGCFQVPEVIIPKVNVKNNSSNSAAADSSSSSSSFEHQIDHHNNPAAAAAEDSPCWKGAPTTTSQFLPFEEESPQPPMKKLHAAAVLDHSFQNSIIPPLVGEQDYAAVKVGCCSSEAAATIKPNMDSTNSQIPKPKLPTQPEMDITSPDMMNIQLLHAANLTKAKQLNNSSGLVKSLYNLSDMLLLHCSNDEFGLKEHDLEALDHVIHNLGVCISKQVTSSKQNSSNMSQEGAYDGGAKLQAMSGVLHDDQTQKPMSDSFGKNMEKLVENASLRGAAPKDDNMLVQAIKKVLDENLEAGCEVELPSLYKDLWLEAEAELCSLSFRARFERLKRDKTYKSKGDASSSSSSAIKEISSCSDPPKLAVIAHSDGDDVEAGVMARLSILKRREDPPNPPDVQVAAAAAGIKDYCGSKGIQVPEATTVIGKDIDPWVMDRLNILKRRGELNANANANAIDVEEKEVRDCGREGPIGGHFQDEEEEEEEEEEAVGSGGGSDWEHILKDEFSWRLS